MINGLSWPATERLTYQLGDKVRWRVINLSSQAHPMHLHGFYFEVDSLGRRPARQANRCPGQAPGRHAAAPVRRHDGDDVDAGARRQLAVPLSHHAPRVAGAAPVCVRAAGRRSPCESRQLGGHGGDDSGRHGRRAGTASPSGRTSADGRRPRKLTLVMARDPAGRRAFVRFCAERRWRPAVADAGSRLDTRSRSRVAPQRTCRDHRGQSPGREHRASLARHGARQLLRRCARVERQRPAPGAAHRTGAARSSSDSRRREPARSCITRICTTSVSCLWDSTVR